MTIDEVPLFAEWVVKQGGVILPLTAPHTILRIRTRQTKTAFIYRNKKGGVSWDPAASSAISAWRAGEAPDLRPKQEAKSLGGYSGLRLRLYERGDHSCFYCGMMFAGPSDPVITIEEVFARARGGLRTMDNCVLACAQCNNEAGARPVVEKIKLRDKMRAKWLRT